MNFASLSYKRQEQLWQGALIALLATERDLAENIAVIILATLYL